MRSVTFEDTLAASRPIAVRHRQQDILLRNLLGRWCDMSRQPLIQDAAGARRDTTDVNRHESQYGNMGPASGNNEYVPYLYKLMFGDMQTLI